MAMKDMERVEEEHITLELNIRGSLGNDATLDINAIRPRCIEH